MLITKCLIKCYVRKRWITEDLFTFKLSNIKKLLPVDTAALKYYKVNINYASKQPVMRLEALPTNVSNILEYRLLDNDQPKLRLKYNTLQHSVRVYANDMHRLFFLQQQPGLLRSKTVFTNEYGVEVGRLSTDKWNGSHFVMELDGKKYHIGVRSSKLVVYTKNIDQPLIICDLDTGKGLPFINVDPMDGDGASSLLLAVCWYLFLPVPGKDAATYYTA